MTEIQVKNMKYTVTWETKINNKEILKTFPDQGVLTTIRWTYTSPAERRYK